MPEKENDKIILEFKKSDEGITVVTYDCPIIDILVGIAETIQLMMEETKENKETILTDISKALEILEEKGGKSNE